MYLQLVSVSLQRPQQYQQPPVPPVSPSIRNSAYSPAQSRLCWRKEGAAKLSAKQTSAGRFGTIAANRAFVQVHDRSQRRERAGGDAAPFRNCPLRMPRPDVQQRRLRLVTLSPHPSRLILTSHDPRKPCR